MNISGLLTLIKSADNCTVSGSAGLPVVAPQHHLPDDFKSFYTLCGGVDLWNQSSYGLTIVSAEAVVPANPIIVGEPCPDDITANWYIIANDAQNNYLTIDLSDSRLGRCYDSSFGRHGIVGSCPIIAQSFSDLLWQLWKNRGQYWYWLQPGFESLGDAYD
jgi:hypothetical protein